MAFLLRILHPIHLLVGSCSCASLGCSYCASFLSNCWQIGECNITVECPSDVRNMLLWRAQGVSLKLAWNLCVVHVWRPPVAGNLACSNAMHCRPAWAVTHNSSCNSSISQHLPWLLQKAAMAVGFLQLPALLLVTPLLLVVDAL